MAYAVSVDRAGEMPVYVLEDTDHGAEARVLPGYGHNCFSFKVGDGSRVYDVLSTPPSVDALRQQPSHWGNPVLFPFPNRISGGAFRFQGRAYDLHDTSSNGNAIHGVLMRRAYRVRSADADATSAWVEAVASTADLPDIFERWPFPFEFALTYRLRGGALRIEAQATNTGSGPMPMGFGIHPYFNAPFAPGSGRSDCEALVPAATRWVLSPSLVPTGERVPVSSDRDLRAFRRLDHIRYDDVLGDLTRKGGWSTCRLRDPRAGQEVYVRSDSAFREIVVFTPPWHPAICFEPYTCTTDAFNLAARGIDSGMVTLEAGQMWRGVVEIGVRRA